MVEKKVEEGAKKLQELSAGRVGDVPLTVAPVSLVMEGRLYDTKTGLWGRTTCTGADKVTTEAKVIYQKKPTLSFSSGDHSYVIFNYSQTTDTGGTKLKKEFGLVLFDGTKTTDKGKKKVDLTFRDILNVDKHGGMYRADGSLSERMDKAGVTHREVEHYVEQLNDIFNENVNAHKWLNLQRATQKSGEVVVDWTEWKKRALK